MRRFDGDATTKALPFELLIPALRDGFVEGAQVPERLVYTLGANDADADVTSLIMPAWVPGGFFGVKIVNVAPMNMERGLPTVHANYTLFDGVTGRPVASLDGSVLTARRTAAVSALAASYLARQDASRLLVVGAGAVAALLPAAYAVVRPITDVAIWARNIDKAERLARTLTEQGLSARAEPDLLQAIPEAHIISCATLSTTPLIKGHLVQAGTHLDLIGSFTPEMREADDTCFAHGARFWVDTEDALRKSGELLSPLQRGVIQVHDLQGTLTTLCRMTASGRRTAEERTIFKSVGYALEDLIAATLTMKTT